jgi:uncharacterized protein YndB with AHSA1/START domain
MAPVSQIRIPASRDQVFGVLTDPTTYPQWLIGAERIRAVDSDWPDPGSSFHHQVGAGPFHVRDRTRVLSITPHAELVLEARAGHFGRAQVTFELSEVDGGTEVHLVEEPSAGPAGWAWKSITRVLLWAGIRVRNDISLRRLGELVTTSGDQRAEQAETTNRPAPRS